MSVYIKQTIADEEDPTKLAEELIIERKQLDNGELDRSQFGNIVLKIGTAAFLFAYNHKKEGKVCMFINW